MNTVRWGLLSTARINRRLIPAIRTSERGMLVGVASRNQPSADAYAADWEIPQAFGSYEAMLESDAVDAVYVSLPNHLHAEWTIRALEAGKHVLCEKPFAISLEEVDKMVAKAKETGLTLAEAFMYRHHPQTKVVGEWVRSGRLGDIISFYSVFSFSGMDPNNVRLIPEYGGGSLWDVGVYPVSLAQFLMGGAPEWVFGDQQLGESGVDMTFAGQLHYGGGRMAQIASSFLAPINTFAQIVGTEGHLTLNRPFVFMDEGEFLTFTPPSGDAEVVPVPEMELYSGEIEDIHAAILDGQRNDLTLAESRDHVRTVLALYESARLGQKIILD
jgi:predicted dehydrogenase